MKLQEARLKEIEPQLEALQRQQAETHLVRFTPCRYRLAATDTVSLSSLKR